MKSIHTIITHHEPHLDELVAIWIISKFGNALFPHAADAKIEYWDAGAMTPDGRTPEQWHSDGYLLIGVGGGMFDEHPTDTQGRKQNTCAATLVAKACDVSDDPSLAQLLEYVLAEDLNGAQGENPAFELGQMIKVMHQTFEPEDVYDWVVDFLDAKYDEQRAFFVDAAKAFQRDAERDRWTTSAGEIDVAMIRSDDAQVSRYARSKVGGQCQLAIQMKSDGHVVITSQKRTGLDLRRAAINLRLDEQRQRGVVSIEDEATLGREGTLQEIPEWFFQPKAGVILNGGQRTKNVPATALSLDQVVDALHRALVQDNKPLIREFEKALRQTVQTPDGPMVITSIASDVEQLVDYALIGGGGTHVFIQRRTNGSTLIAATSVFPLRDLVRALRLRELQARGTQTVPDWKTLGSNGTVESVKEWFFNQVANRISNEAANGPSTLSLDEIRELAEITLNKGYFAPRRANQCAMGVCASTRYNQCELYELGLGRCSKIRYDQSHPPVRTDARA